MGRSSTEPVGECIFFYGKGNEILITTAFQLCFRMCHYDGRTSAREA
jgi:hypothetical protein